MPPAPQGMVVRTSRIGYDEAWRVQRELAIARGEGRIPDVIWLLEHPPVYTVGRHGTRADLFLSDDQLAVMGASVHSVDRGGQMTWHGPGQTTAYTILDLRPHRRVRSVVDHLVGAMADACRAGGVRDVTADAKSIGVYRDGRKLGSVGIRVQHGITTHGIGLNRDPDLEWFALMTACGAPGVPSTSILAEGGDPGRERVEATLSESLTERFGLVGLPTSLEELCERAGITVPPLAATSLA
jgi:lipoyl(octanoyl) transferase